MVGSIQSDSAISNKKWLFWNKDELKKYYWNKPIFMFYLNWITSHPSTHKKSKYCQNDKHWHRIWNIGTQAKFITNSVYVEQSISVDKLVYTNGLSYVLKIHQWINVMNVNKVVCCSSIIFELDSFWRLSSGALRQYVFDIWLLFLLKGKCTL